jgi:hypothetical protein
MLLAIIVPACAHSKTRHCLVQEVEQILVVRKYWALNCRKRVTFERILSYALTKILLMQPENTLAGKL